MPDHSLALKSMLQDIIHDRTEAATVTMHNYFLSKTREVIGLSKEAPTDTEIDVVDEE